MPRCTWVDERVRFGSRRGRYRRHPSNADADIVGGDAVPAGLDAAVFSVAERPDGSLQLVAGDWPLSLFAGDAAPGETNGQGSGDVWFVSAPDRSLIGG